MAVLDFYCDLKRGYAHYPYLGGWRNQAQWFCTLYSVVIREVNRIEEKRIEKAKGGKQR